MCLSRLSKRYDIKVMFICNMYMCNYIPLKKKRLVSSSQRTWLPWQAAEIPEEHVFRTCRRSKKRDSLRMEKGGDRWTLAGSQCWKEKLCGSRGHFKISSDTTNWNYGVMETENRCNGSVGRVVCNCFLWIFFLFFLSCLKFYLV